MTNRTQHPIYLNILAIAKNAFEQLGPEINVKFSPAQQPEVSLRADILDDTEELVKKYQNIRFEIEQSIRAQTQLSEIYFWKNKTLLVITANAWNE